MTRVDQAGKIVLAGVSRQPVCAVRDHTQVLAEALSVIGAECEMVWADLPPALAPRQLAHRLRAWSNEVDARSQSATGVVLQYSVFSYGHRGVPVGFRGWTRTFRRLSCPTVAYIHEAAYDWRDGVRGWLWAATQRVALRSLFGAVDAVAVTTEERVRWLSSCWWLPARPIVFAPVCATLPIELPSTATGPQRPRAGEGPVIGVPGYGAPSARPAPVLDAVARLRSRGVDAQLVLLGSPGPESEGGRRWEALAREAGLAPALRYTGVVPSDALAEAFASCTAVVYTDTGGANGRRTSVAAALALGVPVVAMRGYESWPSLEEAGAVVTTAPAGPQLAEALGPLLTDAARRRAQGERGRSFYASELDVGVVAGRLLSVLGMSSSSVPPRSRED